MLHAGEGMFHAGPHASMFGVVRFLAGQERAAGSFPVRDDEAGVGVSAPSAGTVTSWQIVASPESRHALASAVSPGTGGAVAMTSLVSASMTTCAFAEDR